MARKKDPRQLGLQAKKPVARIPDGYYSGDKPNAKLRVIVENHLKARPYDPASDDYEVFPDVPSIKTSKRTPVYALHGYDSKKPPDALRKYIEQFTVPGDLVLDPFVGSGMTAVACLMSDRKCIGIDASPLATHITSSYCTPFDASELEERVENVIGQALTDSKHPYSTVCGTCGGRAEIYFTVFSQTYQCKRCLAKVLLLNAIEVGQQHMKGKKGSFNAFCPECASKGAFEAISNRQERLGYRPVMIDYACEHCGGKHKIRRADDTDEEERRIFNDVDLRKLEEIEKTSPKHWYPDKRMMWNEEDTGPWGVLWRPYHGDIRRVDQFFTPRNLMALSSILWAIDRVPDMTERNALRFLFSAFLISQSKLQRYHPGSTFPNMVAPGLLYIAPMIKEYNSFWWYRGKARGSVKAFRELIDLDPRHLIVSTQSATDLTQIPSNSIDYILTDPPYSGKIQFGELNFIQEAWLGFERNWLQQEIIVSDVRGKKVSDWSEMMRRAMAECYRVLKPGRWLSLCFHDSSEGTWGIVQDIFSEVGFVPERMEQAVYIDTDQKSLKQITADKVTKRDLIINFRKPKPGELSSAIIISGEEDERTFREKVLTIIQDHLVVNPGTTKDRIYDEVVSRLVRKGRMEAFDFDSVLAEIAYPIAEPIRKNLFQMEAPNLFGTHEIKRWYLKEEADQVDEAETIREDTAAARLETYMSKVLKEHPEREGVHYSDLFEQIVMMDRPRREMADWLIDYFYKTEEGTWRPPITDEEQEEKSRQRATGALRKIKSFARLLESDAVVPERLQPESDREIGEWVHQARRAGLFHQGKVIFEKSGLNLSRLEETDENLAMDVNEDYQYCLKQLGGG